MGAGGTAICENGLPVSVTGASVELWERKNYVILRENYIIFRRKYINFSSIYVFLSSIAIFPCSVHVFPPSIYVSRAGKHMLCWLLHVILRQK